MKWRLSPNVDLDNDRIPSADAERQMHTAAEILTRFDSQPGVVLADEVGMGKTFVALAVAVSAIEATGGEQPVVIMVPASVQEKWPKEWHVFRRACMRGDTSIRATQESARRGGQFLKLLDDPEHRRSHIVFLTHGALTNSLADPYIKLAIVRQAMMWQRDLDHQWRVLPRWADRLFGARELRDEELVAELLHSNPRRWSGVYRRVTGERPEDDLVPRPVIDAVKSVDLSALRDVLRRLPIRWSPQIESRLKGIRTEIRSVLRQVWKECLQNMRIELPLLIMDEAHHLKNPNTRLAGLFDSPTAQGDIEQLRGPFGGVFDRMLFLTATPFQLGHAELLQVLRRFDGISWEAGLDRSLDRDAFHRELGELHQALDRAQSAALRLDHAWGRLTPEDIANVDDRWWNDPDRPELRERARQAALRIQEVDRRMREAEERLRPWVIRHTRTDRDLRRDVKAGRQILDEREESRGLEIAGPAVLPFLLATRAQALVSVRGLRGDARVRAYFAEGLASSFEAYRHTRRWSDGEARLDDEAQTDGDGQGPEEIDWYLRQLDAALPESDHGAFGEHPKLAATVAQVLRLWREGEKVTVFCFYVETGRALRRHISRAIGDELIRMGAAKLGVDSDDADHVRAELDRIGRQFFDDDSRLRREARTAVRRILGPLKMEADDRDRAMAAVLRFLRTESFLVRHMEIGSKDLPGAFHAALDASDGSGVQLRTKILDFGKFLARLVPEERLEMLEALERMQTGGIYVDSTELFDPAEGPSDQEELLPNVRLANGSVLRETRRRLMLAFNTPFFPEILIASAVMAEGVDLHLNCRHLIHHDLDWNPSVLEQRTGRLDRIGSKGEVCGQPVVVYEPFLEATQDEKQYRVVKDRERWFNVVMGERMSLDEVATDYLSQRVPLPEETSERLSLRLQLQVPPTS